MFLASTTFQITLFTFEVTNLRFIVNVITTQTLPMGAVHFKRRTKEKKFANAVTLYLMSNSNHATRTDRQFCNTKGTTNIQISYP